MVKMKSVINSLSKTGFRRWLVGWGGTGAVISCVLFAIQTCCEHDLLFKWGIFIYPGCTFFMETDGYENNLAVVSVAFLESIVANVIVYLIIGCAIWWLWRCAKKIIQLTSSWVNGD